MIISRRNDFSVYLFLKMKPICPLFGSVLIFIVINNCVYAYILSVKPSTRGPICNVNEYMCPDETCIPVEYQCDGTFADCQGGEDELNCGLFQSIVLISEDIFSTL